MNIKETLRDIIREEIMNALNIAEDVDIKPYIGKTVYHGTNSRMIRFIAKKGLMPKPNKYAYQYSDSDMFMANDMSDEEMKQFVKTLPKELFVTPDRRTAEIFAQESIRNAYGGSGPEFRVTKEIVPIVLAFKIKSSDKISKAGTIPKLGKDFDGDPTEIVLSSPISFDRLTIVSPKGAKWLDFYKEKTTVASSAQEKIKQINVILKPYDLKIKSKSTQTDQVGGVYLDPKMKWEPDWALRLSNVAKYLKGEKVKSPFNYVPDADMQKYFDTFFDRISTADKKKIIDILK
jgi:hypothetical protein